MTDFSESEEDLSSDDPEQEGLDVRSAAKELDAPELLPPDKP